MDRCFNLLEPDHESSFTCLNPNLSYSLSDERSKMSESEGGYEGYRPEDVRKALEESFGAKEEIRCFSLELQLQELFEWSEKCCGSLGITLGDYTEFSTGTAEHIVWYEPVAHIAIKKTLSGNYGFIPRLSEANKLESVPADVVSYLRRLELQNDIFNDDVLILGVLPKEPSMVLFAQDTIPIVISQSWHDAREDGEQFPTEEEVEQYLRAKNFQPVADSFYGWIDKDRGIYILDAKPDNFIYTESGIRPIDLQMSDI